eukprot:m.91642 g.91642  ORF g.91642 m.91642 type:complete len:65 (-) comp9916_c0_seq1:443-637(-)
MYYNMHSPKKRRLLCLFHRIFIDKLVIGFVPTHSPASCHDGGGGDNQYTHPTKREHSSTHCTVR